MAEHAALKKALRQMTEGSRSAFHTFYLGSSQYVYSSALLLYDSHEDACRFMVDFYQYLYLHLPEYDRSTNLESWISRLLLERYEQLSIGKDLPKPDVRQRMDAGTAKLSKSELERVWRMLDVQIHFPKETVHRSPLTVVLLISALLLLMLLAGRYLPSAIKHLQTYNSPKSSDVSETPSDDASGNASDEHDSSKSDNKQADELNSIKDELNEHTDVDGSIDDTDELQQQQSQGSDVSGQTTVPESPSEPDTPQTPQAPQEPQTPQEPSMSNNAQNASDIDDLEDLELELRYGDSLRF